MNTTTNGESPIRFVSSMAMRHVLADIADAWHAQGGQAVMIETIGGVELAKRVKAGEAFDAVVLAANAIDELIASGHMLAGSRTDLVRSGVAAAVRAGAARPDLGSEDAVRSAVLAARSLGYSTGPSGVALQKLFERWGIAQQIAPRIVQAPPGVPVASLVARGDVELGFQQLSEMLNAPGIDVLGPLPDAIQIITTFSGGVTSATARPDAVRAVLAYMASPAADSAKKAQGMEPV